MKDFLSWAEIYAKFADLAEKYPDLYARWDARRQLWTFWTALASGEMEPADPAAESLFTEVAQFAVGRLGLAIDETPAHHLWLELMRTRRRGFKGIVKPRNFREFRNVMESGAASVPGVPIGMDGGISHVLRQSANFVKDLDLHGGRKDISPQNTESALGIHVSPSSRGESVAYEKWLHDSVRGAGFDPADPGIAEQLSARLTPESVAKQQKLNDDWTASLRRRRRMHPEDAEKQEKMIVDGRNRLALLLVPETKHFIGKEVLRSRNFSSAEERLEGLRACVLTEFWNNFLPNHRYREVMKIEQSDLESALWAEGIPSLQDRAKDLITQSEAAGSNTASQERIPEGLARLLMEYKIESGLRGADAIERSVLALEQEGHSALQRADRSLQEKADHTMDEIERLGQLLLNLDDLTADQKCALLQEFIEGILTHIRNLYGSDPVIDEAVVPKFESGIALWAAHFQREIWTAEKIRFQTSAVKAASADMGHTATGPLDSASTIPLSPETINRPTDELKGNQRVTGRGKWKPEHRDVIEKYELECSAANIKVTVASIFEHAGIDPKSGNGYKALRGQRLGYWLKIKQVCTVTKPHLKKNLTT